jgi:tetratricopeptide (TPR) repeat protein
MKQSARQQTASARPDPHRTRAVLPLLIAVVTFAVFLRGLQNPFVKWDDYEVFLNNTHYRGLGWDNLRWMFTTFYMGPYQPLAWLSLALDHAVWGMEPFGYHLTSLLLHTVNAVLFYGLARRLLRLTMGPDEGSTWPIDIGAAIAAMLFSIHPLRVESVAWATERRDVLCASFYLLALLAYLRAHEAREARGSGLRWMALALSAMVMSLLAKGMAVTLTAVLVVFDVYPLRRLGGRRGWIRGETRSVWLEKIPFVALSIGFSLVAVIGQRKSGAMDALSQYDPVFRVYHVLYGLSFYLVKTAWPVRLSPLYELLSSLNAAYWRFVLGGVAVLGAGVLFWIKRRRRPGLLCAWLCYVILLSPVLGAFQSGPQIAADRYTYLACMSWAVLAGAVAVWYLRGVAAGPSSRRRLAVVLSAALPILGALGASTYRQIGVWSGSQRLWQHVLALNPNCLWAHINLGDLLLESGKPDEALPWFERAVQLFPYGHWGYARLGAALAALNRKAEARAAFQRALELCPEDWATGQELGLLLLEQHEDEAAALYLKRVVELRPEDPQARGYYGNALRHLGRLDAAAAQYRRAIESAPGEPRLYTALASTLTEARKYGDAEAALRRGLQIRQGDPRLTDALAWLLATCPEPRYRNGTEAVRLAESACRATDNSVPRFVATLAAAYAEAGRFEQAVEKQRLAIGLAEKQGQKDLATQFQSRLSLFARRQPYRLAQ